MADGLFRPWENASSPRGDCPAALGSKTEAISSVSALWPSTPTVSKRDALSQRVRWQLWRGLYEGLICHCGYCHGPLDRLLNRLHPSRVSLCLFWSHIVYWAHSSEEIAVSCIRFAMSLVIFHFPCYTLLPIAAEMTLICSHSTPFLSFPSVCLTLFLLLWVSYCLCVSCTHGNTGLIVCFANSTQNPFFPWYY